MPKTSDHFYTTSITERNNAVANDGYVYEQIACHVHESAASGTTPLHRLFHPGFGDHFYTTSDEERNNAVANSGYVYEQAACHVFGSAAAGTTPLHRLWRYLVVEDAFSAVREDAVTQSGARRMWTEATYFVPENK